MKITLIAVVLAGMCGGVYAADFSDLQNLSASEVKGSAVNIPAPEAVTVENIFMDQNGVDRLSDLPGSSPYEKLENLFKEGVPATKEDLTGWYSGRFAGDFLDAGPLLTLPNAFGAALIVGRPVSDEFTLNYFSYWDVPYDYFDRMGPDSQAVRQIKGFLPPKDYVMRNRKNIIIFPQAILEYNEGDDFHRFQYRKARGYLVAWHYKETRFSSPQSAYNTYSYYFKNVTPKK